MIEMEAIRDDGGRTEEPWAHASPEDFLASMRRLAEDYRRDRTEGQPGKLMIFCEAAGMVLQLAAVANYYGVPVDSSGGFDSVTEKYQLAQRIMESERRVEVLHIGDYDQSGVHTALNLTDRMKHFLPQMAHQYDEFARAQNVSPLKGWAMDIVVPGATELNGESYRLKQSAARRKRGARPFNQTDVADPQIGEINLAN